MREGLDWLDRFLAALLDDSGPRWAVAKAWSVRFAIELGAATGASDRSRVPAQLV